MSLLKRHRKTPDGKRHQPPADRFPDEGDSAHRESKSCDGAKGSAALFLYGLRRLGRPLWRLLLSSIVSWDRTGASRFCMDFLLAPSTCHDHLAKSTDPETFRVRARPVSGASCGVLEGLDKFLQNMAGEHFFPANNQCVAGCSGRPKERGPAR